MFKLVFDLGWQSLLDRKRRTSTLGEIVLKALNSAVLILAVLSSNCVQTTGGGSPPPQDITIDVVEDIENEDSGEPTDTGVDTAEPIPDIVEDTTTVTDLGPPPDEEAPTWEDDATLSAVAVGEDHLTLTWTSAKDESGLKAYIVYKDEQLVTKLAAEHQSLQINQLAAGTAYVFRVEAEDTVGNTSESGPTLTVATTDETSPTWSDDAQLSGDNITAESLTLSWSTATYNVAVTGYRVYRDNIEIGVTDEETLAYEVTGLMAWTSYNFRIEAEDAYGNLSNGGPQWNAQTTDITVPTWSEGSTLVASQLTPYSCYLGWDAGSDNVEVTAYQLLQDKVEIAILEGDVTWAKVEGLSPWTTYEFEVHAWDAAGNQTEAALSVTVSTPDNEAPTWDENSAIIPSNPTDSGVTLGWNGATDDVAVTSYRLYQDNVEIGVFDGDTLSADVAGLNKTTSYIFRVEAEDAAGNLSFGGPILAMDLSDKTAPVWPVDASLTMAESTPTSVTLSWTTDNAGVAGYQVMENDQVIASTPEGETSVTVTGLAPMTTYSFSVTASDAAGNSTANSLSLDVTTPDYSAPVWPEDASLSTSDVTDSSVILTWTDIGVDVSTYDIYQDDAWVLSVPSAELSATVTGLSPLTDYSFRIEATGPTGKVSTDGPSENVTTTDMAAPSWPANATLIATDITESTLTLTWTALHDDQPVTSYNVHKDGTPLGSVNAPENSIQVVGLSVGETITFKVEAVGPTGQISSDGPGTTITVSDVTAPTWGANATLTVDAVTETTATLSWMGATDDVGVTGYEVFVDGNSDGTIGGNVTVYMVEGLAPDTSYDFQVQALDGAGNTSVDGPSAQGVTNAPAQGTTDQDVLDAFQPTCSACHAGWFSSMDAFKSSVVDNDKVITPGDPDGSLLILFLEENGPTFTQMPPAGDSYMDMSDKGETSLTVQEIRDWITAM